MKAFPTNISVATGGDSWITEHGMDLRDYFAAKAMQGIMSKEHFDGSYGDVSMYAYKCADAMMKAREKK